MLNYLHHRHSLPVHANNLLAPFVKCLPCLFSCVFFFHAEWDTSTSIKFTDNSCRVYNALLASVFAESSAFCGNEDVLHAVIYHQLRKAGQPHTRIAREQALANNRVDIVLYGNDVAGNFSATQMKPVAAIEVKGGAYGTRNALRDEIDASGYCADMDKLKPEAARGVESWFICVDMPELGRAISPAKVELVSEQCALHGLSFAYYCQGENQFFVAHPKKQPVAVGTH